MYLEAGGDCNHVYLEAGGHCNHELLYVYLPGALGQPQHEQLRPAVSYEADLHLASKQIKKKIQNIY
jgi:hypothetical protein